MARSASPSQGVQRGLDENGRATGVVLASGAVLGLREFLKLPWFFPKNFKHLKTREGDEFIEVIGRQEIYRFPRLFAERYLTAEAEEFHLLWRAACREISGTVLWAPAVAIGLRPYRWVDGEPEWLWEAPRRDVLPSSPPMGANGFAIVSRRLEEYHRLDVTLKREGRVSAQVFSHVATVLEIFHRRSGRSIRRQWAEYKRIVRRHLREQYSEIPHQQFQAEASHLSSTEYLAATEALRFVSGVFGAREEQFLVRGEEGHLVTVHGDLRAPNVYLHRVENRGRRLLIVNRPRSSSVQRFDDRLHDVATFTLDLKVRGYHELSELFTEHYFSRAPEAFDPFLWRVVTAHTALLESFRRRAYEGEQRGITQALRKRLLAQAFVFALGVSLPILVGIETVGELERTGSEMLRVFEELIPDFRVMDLGTMTPAAEEFTLSTTQEYLLSGYSVGILFPRRSSLLFQLFTELSAKVGARALLVLATPLYSIQGESLWRAQKMKVFLPDPILTPLDSVYRALQDLSSV